MRETTTDDRRYASPLAEHTYTHTQHACSERDRERPAHSECENGANKRMSNINDANKLYHIGRGLEIRTMDARKVQFLSKLAAAAAAAGVRKILEIAENEIP